MKFLSLLSIGAGLSIIGDTSRFSKLVAHSSNEEELLLAIGNTTLPFNIPRGLLILDNDEYSSSLTTRGLGSEYRCIGLNGPFNCFDGLEALSSPVPRELNVENSEVMSLISSDGRDVAIGFQSFSPPTRSIIATNSVCSDIHWDLYCTWLIDWLTFKTAVMEVEKTWVTNSNMKPKDSVSVGDTIQFHARISHPHEMNVTYHVYQLGSIATGIMPFVEDHHSVAIIIPENQGTYKLILKVSSTCPLYNRITHEHWVTARTRKGPNKLITKVRITSLIYLVLSIAAIAGCHVVTGKCQTE